MQRDKNHDREIVRTKLTPPELAAQWGIGPDKVVGWIRSGELRAVNAAAREGGRPRFLIDVRDIEAFEARRAVVVRPARTGRRRRQKDNTIQFFK